MLSPDIREILYDPDVGGGQAFIVERKTKKRSKGRLSDEAEVEIINAIGSVQPAGVDVLQQLQEADRRNTVIVVRTETPMQMGSTGDDGDVLADEILYRGGRYKILQLKDWTAWGMSVAYATRVGEA